MGTIDGDGQMARNDRQPPPAPGITTQVFRQIAVIGFAGKMTGMVLIPAGNFTMGDSFAEGQTNELPVHTVYVSAFYMDKYEVSKALWDDVKGLAFSHGYAFDNSGSGKATNHPVPIVSWYDVVKWCSARSEKEGRIPAYYTDAAQTTIYRTGQTNFENSWVKWNTGYPTYRYYGLGFRPVLSPSR
jgi:hypothetical protein